MHPVQRKLELVRVYQSYEAIEALRSTFHSPANGNRMSMHDIAFKAQVQINTILSIGKMAREVAFCHDNAALEKHMIEKHMHEHMYQHMLENDENNGVDKNVTKEEDIQQIKLDAAYTMLSLGT